MSKSGRASGWDCFKWEIFVLISILLIELAVFEIRTTFSPPKQPVYGQLPNMGNEK